MLLRYRPRIRSSMDYAMLGNSTHTEMYLPMPIQISVCGVLLLMSSMFAGLTLGLMSLGMMRVQCFGVRCRIV